MLADTQDPVLRGELADCVTWEQRCETVTRLAELGARVHADNQPVDSVRRVAEDLQDFSRTMRADLAAFAGRSSGEIRGAVERLDGVAQREEQLLQRVADRVEGEKGSPVKGNTFEERTYQRLLRHAESRGDAVEWTGATSGGPDGSKKGDVVYRMRLRNGSGRELPIALEVKAERATRRGKDPFFLDQLNEAMRNRGCECGIVVVREDENRQGDERLFPRFQQIDPHRIVVLVEDQGGIPAPLEVALNLLEAQALAQDGSDEPIDLEAVRQEADDVLRSMAMLSNLKKSVTQSIAAMGNVREDLDSWDAQVSEGLQRIRDLLAGKAPSRPPEPQGWQLAGS